MVCEDTATVCGMLLLGLVQNNMQHPFCSSHLAFSLVVLPYNSTDTAAAWDIQFRFFKKNLFNRFNLKKWIWLYSMNECDFILWRNVNLFYKRNKRTGSVLIIIVYVFYCPSYFFRRNAQTTFVWGGWGVRFF